MEPHWKAVAKTALMFFTLIIFSKEVHAHTNNGWSAPNFYAYTESYLETFERFYEILTISNKIIKVCAHVENETAFKIARSVHKYSNKYDIPAEFILTIIYTESRFKPNAVGSTKDTGLMQVVPKYHRTRLKKLGVKLPDLKKIDTNIKVGCDILADAKEGRPNTKRTLWLMAKKYNGRSSYANKVMYRYKKLFGS